MPTASALIPPATARKASGCTHARLSLCSRTTTSSSARASSGGVLAGGRCKSSSATLAQRSARCHAAFLATEFNRGERMDRSADVSSASRHGNGCKSAGWRTDEGARPLHTCAACRVEFTKTSSTSLIRRRAITLPPMGTCKGVHNSMAAVGVVGTIASMQASTSSAAMDAAGAASSTIATTTPAASSHKSARRAVSVGASASHQRPLASSNRLAAWSRAPW